MSEFLNRLAGLILSRTIFATLRRCHRPCQRLLTFEDFCQDVFVRAVQHGEQFHGKTDAELAAWLRAIGNQRMVDALRRSAKERTVPLQIDVAEDDTPTNVDRILWLMQVLNRLVPEDRDLLVRRYWKRESWKKISADLKIAPNTLAQRHLRLLRMLRAQGDAVFSKEKLS